MSQKTASYWKANIILILECLAVWFVASYLFAILLAPELNVVRLGGYKLGFWFAQQGSIYIFIILIFYYVKRMAMLDKKFGVEE